MDLAHLLTLDFSACQQCLLTASPKAADDNDANDDDKNENENQENKAMEKADDDNDTPRRTYGINAILIDFFLYDTMKNLEAEHNESIPHHRTRSIWY